MGGLIAALYLAKNPADFDAAVLSAPMLHIAKKQFTIFGIQSEELAYAWAIGCGVRDDCSKFAIGQGPAKRHPLFLNDISTSSRVRFDKELELETRFNVWSGGVSNQWAAESIRVTHRFSRGGPKVTTPVLLLQAGLDSYVAPDRQNLFCSRALKCVKKVFANSKHGILKERDEIRTPAIEEILKFYSEY